MYGNNHLIQGNTVEYVYAKPEYEVVGKELSGINVAGSGHRVLDNNIAFAGKRGIMVGPGDTDIYIAGNDIKNCGFSGGYNAGIVIQVWDSANPFNMRTTIENNRVWDDQATPTTKYGLNLLPDKGSIIALVVKDNDFSGASVVGIIAWESEDIVSPTFENNLGGIQLN